MKSTNEKKESRIVGVSGSISGAASVLGSWQVCHSICTAIIIVLSMMGITLSTMPLLFLTKIASVMWGIAATLFAATLYFYLAKKCISSALVMLNTGLLVMGIPFAALQQFILLFYGIGGTLAVSGLVLLMQPLIQEKKWGRIALFSSIAVLFIILFTVGAISKDALLENTPAKQAEQKEYPAKISGDASTGNVEILAKPLGMVGGAFAFDVFFNTHSVDLSGVNLEDNILLIADGKAINPTTMPTASGHHTSGKLTFGMPNEPLAFTLVFTNIPSIQKRELEWKGIEASGQMDGSFSSAIGKQAPDFELQEINGNTIKLSSYKGKNVVLFFNEGSMCYPSCWNQIAALANDARFDSDDTVAFSITVDSPAQWQKIMQQVPKMSTSKLLFDTSKKVSSDYDVLFLPSSMHKGSYPGHTYLIIDKNGVIRYTKDDPSMAIRNDELFAELKKLKGE